MAALIALLPPGRPPPFGALLTLAVLASMLLANKLLSRILGSLFRMV